MPPDDEEVAEGLVHKPLHDGAWVALDKAWLDETEARALQEALTEALAWEQVEIVAFGAPVVQPRLTAWAGELPYRYSGQTLAPRAAPPVLDALRERVEAVVGHRFNHAVINRYRDGRDHMARHADNEPELGRCPVIAAVSLGTRRRFVLERKARRGTKRTLSLTDGSLLVMGGTCQHTWRHSVPRMAHAEGERLNVTFRWLHGPPGWRQPADEGVPPRGRGRPPTTSPEDVG